MRKYLKYIISFGLITSLQISLIMGVYSYLSLKNSKQISFKEEFLKTYFKQPLTITGSKDEQFIQAQSNTCGPAALGYMMNIYGLMLSEEEIASQVTLTERGSSLFDLINVARNYGFNAWGEKQNFQGLLKTKLPVLAHINNRHYVIIDRIDSEYLTMFDPAMGMVKIRREYFQQAWTGYVLLLEVKTLISTDKEVIGHKHTTI